MGIQDTIEEAKNETPRPKAKRKRPTLAQVREEEREICRKEMNYLLDGKEHQVVSDLAFLTLSTGAFSVHSKAELVEALAKKAVKDQLEGFLLACSVFDMPEYLTKALAEQETTKTVVVMTQLYRATVKAKNAEFLKRLDDARAKREAAAKTEADPDAVEFHGKKWQLSEDEKAYVTRQKLDAIGGSGKISASKALRARTGLGLYESKQIIDMYCLKKGIK